MSSENNEAAVVDADALDVLRPGTLPSEQCRQTIIRPTRHDNGEISFPMDARRATGRVGLQS